LQNLNRKNITEFVKFGIVGASNTVISLAIYYLFIWIDPKYYIIGNVVGWVVSVANSYLWNSIFVFHSKYENIGKTLNGLLKSYISYGSTLLLTTLLLYLEVELAHWSEAICPIINLCITVPLNYILNKFWTFR
jgi:putative flippase GtrA